MKKNQNQKLEKKKLNNARNINLKKKKNKTTKN
jgi:hypothetical protein